MLNRWIYGLNQASRNWNHLFDNEIPKYGFIINEDESCVYNKTNGRSVSFLVLYVDAILIEGNYISNFQGLRSWLGECFSMKDTGEEAYIIGIKIYADM